MDLLIKDSWFATEFVRPTESRDFDFLSVDEEIGLEVKSGAAAVRNFHANALQVAFYLDRRPTIRLGCLVIDRDRMSKDRVVEEWDQIRRVLRPDVGGRMAVVAIGHDGVHVDPPDPRLIRIGQLLKPHAEANGSETHPLTLSVPRRGALEEVLRVLLVRLLRRAGPIRLGDLADRIGYSRVTTLVAIRLLSARKALNRVPNRPVELARFPTDQWNELVARERNQPGGWRFVDTAGQPPNLDRLLARIVTQPVPGLALGGVSAARHWCPELDLNGTPRLDFVLHAPDGTADLAFVRRADPALKLVAVDEAQTPLVVVHPIRRTDPLFEHGPAGGLPVADPVETALHLEGLRLPAQAKQVLAHLHPELQHL